MATVSINGLKGTSLGTNGLRELKTVCSQLGYNVSGFPLIKQVMPTPVHRSIHNQFLFYS